jgi:predicted transcriptional regulator
MVQRWVLLIRKGLADYTGADYLESAQPINVIFYQAIGKLWPGFMVVDDEASCWHRMMEMLQPADGTSKKVMEWKNVHPSTLEAILKAIKQKDSNVEKIFDVDFIGVNGNSNDLFDFSEISKFFGNNQGKIYNCAYKEKLRGSKDRYGVIFGECGRYQLGTVVESPSDMINKGSHLIKWNEEVARVNSIFSKEIKGQNMAFRDFSEKVKLVQSNIYVQKYGQKMSLEDFESLMKCIPDNVHVDIAVALEVGIKDAFVLADSTSQKLSSDCYSLFLSDVGCNLLLKEKEKCHLLFAKAYRY